MNNIKSSTLTSAEKIEYEKWLVEILAPEEVAKVRGTSVDTVNRDERLRGKWLKLGKRRKGLRRRDALLMP
jgi:hypothetical protein